MKLSPRAASARHAAWFLVPALLLAACEQAPPPPPARNLLLISIDTLRADALGAYGADHGISPNIDALAAGGVVFENAISPCSWTLPAFASLLTSTYPSTHKVHDFSSRLDPSFLTLGEVLDAAGFATAAVTSHVYVGPRFGMAQGIADFDDSLVAGNKQAEEKVSSPGVTRLGIERLERLAAGQQRWFLWLHYFDPHFPYIRHDDPAAAEGDSEADYRGEIAFTDRWIGQVLDALERLGAAEDTLVVLVSDHGEEFREHAKLRHGYTLFREVLHVPFIVRSPGVAPRRVRQAVSGVDLLPTLLELLGLATPASAVGRSLVPAMIGNGLDAQPVLSKLSLHPEYRADSLQLGPWKLVLDHTGRSLLAHALVPGGSPDDAAVVPHAPGVETGEQVLLYRIDRDPAEQHDVAGEHPDVVARLRGTLEALQQRARAASQVETNVLEHSAEELELMRQLGYLGSADESDD